MPACVRSLALGFSLSFVSLFFALDASAQNTIVVDYGSDAPDTNVGDCICDVGGWCSLRAAVQEANGWVTNNCAGVATAAPTIVLSPQIYGLYELGTGEDNAVTGDLDIRAAMTITADASKVGPVIIDGGFSGDSADVGTSLSDRVFHIIGDPISTTTNFTVNLQGLHIRHGYASDRGGAIYNTNGDVHIDNCTFENNWAPYGGAISNQARNVGGSPVVTAELYVYNSTFTGNQANIGAAYSANDFTGWSGAAAHFQFVTFANNIVRDGLPGWGSSPEGAVFNLALTSTTDVTSSVFQNNRSYGGSTNEQVTGPNQATIGWAGRSVADALTGGNNPGAPTLATGNAQLGALRFWGGSTYTLMPSVGSPARDIVISGTGKCDTGNFDQRRFSRQINGACDAGAVEGHDCPTDGVTYVAALPDPRPMVPSPPEWEPDTFDIAPGDGTCADSLGVCSLRAAVNEANACPNADIVQLQQGNYYLDRYGSDENYAFTGDLDLVESVTVKGPPPGSTTLTTVDACTFVYQGNCTDRNLGDRVFHIPFHDKTVRLTGFEVRYGTTSETTLIVSNVFDTTRVGGGAGILNQGSDTTIDHMTIGWNAVSDPDGAGPHYMSLGGGVANIADCTGNGVHLTMRAVTLLNNSVNLTNGTQSAGGGYASFDCDQLNPPPGTLANESSYTDVEFSTIVNNYSRNAGSVAWLWTWGAAGTIDAPGTRHHFANNLMVGNSDSDGPRDSIYGDFPILGGTNMIGGSSAATPEFETHQGTTWIMINAADEAALFTAASPVLSGGPTEMMVLATDSVALDRVSASASCATSNTDQRYFSRSNGTVRPSTPCDVGAYEAACGAPKTYLVDDTEDLDDMLPGNRECMSKNGTCTLRAAISEANACPGADTIHVTPGLYALTLNNASPGSDDENRSGDLDVTDSVVIEPDPDSPAGLIILDGAGLLAPVGNSPGPGERIMSVISSTPGVALRYLQFQNGTSDNGGALSISGTPTEVLGCTFKNNTATSYGGAISMSPGWFYAASTVALDLSHSTFIGNTAPGGGAMAIMATDGSATVRGEFLTFTDNRAHGSPVPVIIGPSRGPIVITDGGPRIGSGTGGGAVFADGGYDIQWSNSVFFGNYSDAAPIDDFEAPTGSQHFDVGYSVVADTRTDHGITGSAVHPYDPALPALQDLAYFGGYTETRMPPLDSQLRDHVDIGVGRCAATNADQTVNVRLVGTACDPGAVEGRAPPPLVNDNQIDPGDGTETDPGSDPTKNNTSLLFNGSLAGGGLKCHQSGDGVPYVELMLMALFGYRMRRRDSRKAGSNAKSG